MQRCVNSRIASRIVGRRRLDGVLVDHAEPAAGERQREHRHDGRAGPQRERGQRGRRRRRPVEEVHVDGVGRLDVLVDEHRDRLVRLERAQHAPDRAAAVDHGVAGLHPRRLEQVVQQRIVERPREHRHRLERERVHERVDLPEAEVPGEEQRALAVRVRGARPAPRPRTPRARASAPGVIVLNLRSTVSSRPKCANISRAIARHSASAAQRKRRLRGCASPAAGAAGRTQ